MDRGYSLVYNTEQELIKNVEQVDTNDLIQIQLNNGKIDCQVLNVESSVKYD
jgi:exodeoxyribonuclease VII large subunit